MSNKEIVAFIPVRGGSKSIPMKNIKEINGQPLVYWTIDAAVNCPLIDKVYVSTDSDEIQFVVNSYNKQNSEKLICIGRSPLTATDTASTESAMLEFAKANSFDTIVLIQATSPLLSSNDLEKAVQKYKRDKFDSLLSLVRQKRFIWEDGDIVKPINYSVESRPRRQDFRGILVENGAFYITKRDLLLNSKTRLSGKIGYYEMPEESFYEIDEPSDWFIIEELLYRKKPVKLNKRNN